MEKYTEQKVSRRNKYTLSGHSLSIKNIFETIAFRIIAETDTNFLILNGHSFILLLSYDSAYFTSTFLHIYPLAMNRRFPENNIFLASLARLHCLFQTKAILKSYQRGVKFVTILRTLDKRSELKDSIYKVECHFLS